MSATKMLDVIGVVESAAEHQTITLKNGRDTDKRSVVIRDQSNRSIEITLWGKYSTAPGDQISQVGCHGWVCSNYVCLKAICL